VSVEHSKEHSAEWQDRLQDAIDADAHTQTEVQAHLESCAQCRREFAKLTALHAQLQSEFAAAPALSDDFSARVFARIDEYEQSRRDAAKQRAEQEFQRRMRAFHLDWRELWQRHTGNLVAALAVIVALVTASSPMLETLNDRVHNVFAALPEPVGRIALPILLAAAASIAMLLLTRTRAKVR
jgi:hypothetical protein